MAERKTLLIGLGAPFYRDPAGDLFVEPQTVSGLFAWQANFEKVVCYSICRDGPPPEGYVEANAAGLIDPNFELLPLPNTYSKFGFGKNTRIAREMLSEAIHTVDFRLFSYGGGLGDPGEIAASICRREGIKHGVWLDRVESQVVLQMSKSAPSLSRKVRRRVMAAIIGFNERRALRAAELGLLHGETVFRAFHDLAKNPKLAEDIHIREKDRISAEALRQKILSTGGGPLKILYVGRAHPMKGGLDWIKVLSLLKKLEIPFRARWLGDGEQLQELKSASLEYGIGSEELEFAGNIVDRSAVLEAYRNADLFLFCHQTDESPRNLIESLHSGTPIVGYSDPFAEKLVAEKGAGVLVARGKIDDLAKAVSEIASNRERLRDLIRRAGESCKELTREKVFLARSEIVKSELGEGGA